MEACKGVTSQSEGEVSHASFVYEKGLVWLLFSALHDPQKQHIPVHIYCMWREAHDFHPPADLISHRNTILYFQFLLYYN